MRARQKDTGFTVKTVIPLQKPILAIGKFILFMFIFRNTYLLTKS